MSALAVVPKQQPVALTLYELEEQVSAMVETAQGGVPAEVEQEFLTCLATLLESAAEKRDQVGQFCLHLESQIAFAQAEITRLQARKVRYQRALDQIEEYLIKVIRSLPPDAKGKPPKLEGHTITLSIRKCPASVEITEPEAIPAEYVTQTVSVRLPAALWETLLDSLDFELRNQVLDMKPQPDSAISKPALKKALESGSVPGASLVTDKYTLVRK